MMYGFGRKEHTFEKGMGKKHNSIGSEVTNSDAHGGQGSVQMSELFSLGTSWVKWGTHMPPLVTAPPSTGSVSTVGVHPFSWLWGSSLREPSASRSGP